MPPGGAKEENGGKSESSKGEMSVNLKALLMVDQSGNNGKPVHAAVISYDYCALMEIGKNAASRQRPVYLEPEYDFIAKNDPHPRWDPERWHAGTKAQHMKKTASIIKENGVMTKPDAVIKGGGQDTNWRKKDKRSSLVMDEDNDAKTDEGEFRLGPQRRSYKEGCKPQNTRDSESSFKKDGGGLANTSSQSAGWREQRKRDNDRGWRRGADDEDKFRDFRKDDGREEGRRSSRFNRDTFDSGRNSRQESRYNRGHYGGRHDDVDDEPEWMTDGPVNQFDFMELGGFEDDHRGRKPDRPRNSDSPILEPFDPSAFGATADDVPSKNTDVLLDGPLEGLAGPGEDVLDADINGLLGSIGNDILDDDDDDALDETAGGSSRFTQFFKENSSKPDSPKKESPPMANIQRLDPSVWSASSEPIMPQQIHRQLRPGAPSMASIRPNVNQIPAALFPGALPVNRAFLNPSQPIRLEELEGRGGPSPIENQPPPDIQMKLLNLSKQRNEFEAKNSIQRMMLLQQQQQGKQQQQAAAAVATHPSLHAGPGNPFANIPGAPRGGGRVGAPFLDSRSLEPGQNPLHQIRKPAVQQIPSVQPHDKRDIYQYLLAERKNRKLTPTEEKFTDKYEIELQMVMDQNLNFGRHDERMQPPFPGNLSLERQKQLFDEKLRQQSGMDRPGPPNGPGANHEPAQKQNQFNQFTPTSVMRKMVRTRDDGVSASERPSHRSQKITPLEYTGVTRVPKSVQNQSDAARKLSGGGNGGLGGKPTQQQQVGMRTIPGAPQVNFIPAGMMARGPGQTIASIPNQQQMMQQMQQMIMRQQMAQRQQQAPPPTIPTDPFTMHQRKQQQSHRGGQPGMSVDSNKTPTDENIHIHKLLTPNRPGQYPDFG